MGRRRICFICFISFGLNFMFVHNLFFKLLIFTSIALISYFLFFTSYFLVFLLFFFIRNS